MKKHHVLRPRAFDVGGRGQCFTPAINTQLKKTTGWPGLTQDIQNLELQSPTPKNSAKAWETGLLNAILSEVVSFSFLQALEKFMPMLKSYKL